MRAVMRCVEGMTESFKVVLGLYQGSALSPFMFAMVKDRLTDEVRQESPWMIMLKRWRFVLERRRMKVSCSKTEFVCK